MREIRIFFACNHMRVIADTEDIADMQCLQCGSRRVKHVSAPRPTVRAVECQATSPLLVKE